MKSEPKDIQLAVHDAYEHTTGPEGLQVPQYEDYLWLFSARPLP